MGQWAKKHDRCVKCGTTERPHDCHGMCGRCRARYATPTLREQRNASVRRWRRKLGHERVHILNAAYFQKWKEKVGKEELRRRWKIGLAKWRAERRPIYAKLISHLRKIGKGKRVERGMIFRCPNGRLVPTPFNDERTVFIARDYVYRKCQRGQCFVRQHGALDNSDRSPYNVLERGE